MPDERDEDELLDEKAAAIDKAIENGDPIDWNDNDRAFIALAEDDSDGSERSDDGETDTVDDGDEGDLSDDGETDAVDDGDDCAAGDNDADAGDNLSDEDREALDDYISPDITTNNPISYNER